MSGRVNAFQWRVLGQTLRGVDDSPAYLSILFAIINAETDINFRGRRGRPSLNLLNMIRNDINVRKAQI